MQNLFETYKIFFLVFSGFIGLAIGSFLNVVALRLLKEESFIKGRSKCPKCEKLIAWYDNLPVLSFLILGGKCRHCSEKISIQYPIVEILTSALYVFTVHEFGITLKTLFLLFLISSLIVITITDLREQFIFDITSIPLIPIGLIYSFFNIGNVYPTKLMVWGINVSDVFISAILGAILGVLFFEIFSRIGLLLAGEYAFGTGDTILAAALGAWFGWKLMIIIIVLSFLSQLLFGVPMIMHNLVKAKDTLSIWAMAGLALALFLTYLGRYFTYTGQSILAICLILSSFVITGISIFIILKRTKERKSHTFLPFGPALVFGGLLVIFFSETFLSCISF